MNLDEMLATQLSEAELDRLELEALTELYYITSHI